jgi:hypothetical protein
MVAGQKLDPKIAMTQGNDSLIENTEGQNSSGLALVDLLGTVTFDRLLLDLVYHSSYFKTKVIKPSNNPII